MDDKLHTPVQIVLQDIQLALPDSAIDAIAESVAQLINTRRRFLSKTALAAQLGVTPRTIKTWREHGLPGRRVGREVMFDLAEVERWIDGEGS